MQIAVGKKYRKRRRYLGSLLSQNPVLVLGLDLPFVIATGVSLKNAVAMTLELLIIHMVTMCMAMVVRRQLPFWGRALVHSGTATVMMVLARLLLDRVFPETVESAGMYVYLMAVNGMTIYFSAHLPKHYKIGPELLRAFLSVVGFGITMLVVSLPREYFGSGSLWGVVLPAPYRLTGLLVPFSGFILMGFLLAFVKYLNKILLAFSMREAMRRDLRYTPVDPRAQ